MAQSNKSAGFWTWLFIAFIVAAIAIGTLYYIGWFDSNAHVDSLNGDNVEQQYTITGADADAPGEADWQNDDHQTLREEITEPEAETETPPVRETPEARQ